MPALRRAATSEEKQALLVKDQESQSPEDDGAGGDTFSWQGANKSEASLENVTIDALFLNFEYVHKLFGVHAIGAIAAGALIFLANLQCPSLVLSWGMDFPG